MKVRKNLKPIAFELSVVLRLSCILFIALVMCFPVIAAEPGQDFPEGSALQVRQFSDGTLAYSYKDAQGKYRVARGSDRSEPYDYIGRFVMSTDGANLAFEAQSGHDWYVVSGQKIFGPYSETEEPVCLKDGSTLVFRAQVDNDVCIVIGTEEHRFSRDSMTEAFFDARNGAIGPVPVRDNFGDVENLFVGGKTFIVLQREDQGCFVKYGTRVLGPFNLVQSFIEGPNAGEISFPVVRNGRFFIVSGDTTRGPYERILSLEYNSRRKAVAYTAERDGSLWLYYGDEAFGPFDDIGRVSGPLWSSDPEQPALVFSPDGGSIAFRARIGESWYIVCGQRRYGPYEKVDRGFLVSPDGVSVAYSALIGGAWYAMRDGISVGGPYESIGYDERGYDSGIEYYRESAFSYDGDGISLLYAVKKSGKSYLIRGNQETGPFDFIVCLTQSGDRTRYAAIVGKEGKCFTLNNGRLEGPFDRVDSLDFARDGNLLPYSCGIAGKDYIYLNGQKSGPYDVAGILGVSVPAVGALAVFEAHIDGAVCLVNSLGELLYKGLFIPQAATYSGDGSEFATIVQTPGESYLVTNSGVVGPFSYIWDDFTFPEDGSGVVFSFVRDGVVQRGKFSDRRLITGHNFD